MPAMQAGRRIGGATDSMGDGTVVGTAGGDAAALQPPRAVAAAVMATRTAR
jgi:hypothetical protein